ncbi:MAG: LptF/LptG family permease [Gemmatimonadaceae bacterium]
MKILNRYVLKEHAGPLAFAVTALTSLLLLNYIAKQFGNLVGKGLPWTVIAEFFVLSMPFTIAMTLPMAVLVAVLYAFSRLASENEITALKASGVGLNRLLVPVLWGAGALALLMVGFHDQVLPRANHTLRVLQGDIARKKPTFALREQVINEVASGKLYLRANHIDEASNLMREVTIYDLGDPQRRRTIYADSGNMGLTPGGSDLELTLWNGVMQEVQRTDPGQLQRLFYTTDRIRVRGVGNQFEKSTNDDYKSDREMSICEMQSEVAKASATHAAARRDLAAALVGAARHAATGATTVPPAGSRPAASANGTGFGLGRAYCGALAALGAPTAKQALAATVAAERADTMRDSTAAARAARPMAPSTGMVGTERLPAPGTAAPMLPTAFTPEQLNAQITIASQRMDESAQTIDANEVEIQKKFALSMACVVFVLLGAPIALRFPRGGVGLTIGVSLVVFSLYYVGLIAGEALADRGFLPPFWAMWAANVLFAAVGLVLMARMGREGSTSRGGDFGELREQMRLWLAKQARKLGIPAERRARATT